MFVGNGLTVREDHKLDKIAKGMRWQLYYYGLFKEV